MHDTAMHIGSLLFETYCNAKSPTILEIGSSDVNGTLRDVAPRQSRYVGIDFEAGAGVDIVTTAGAPLAVDDESFDFALASSVFEHDPAFWNSFVEMVRKVRPGGIVYINVPSNGAIHRYPEDHWRFYPDSGKALARWAVAQGQPIELIESFVAPRNADMWNDFVAVFRKGPSRRQPPAFLLYQKVPGAMNVQVGRATAFLNPVACTEDMDLIARAQASAVEHAQRVASHEAALARCAADTAECQARLAQSEARELQQRQDFETRAERALWDLTTKDTEIAHAREMLDVANRARATREGEARSLTAAIIAAGRKIFAIAEERAEALSAVRAAQSELDASRRECATERHRADHSEVGLGATTAALEQALSDAALRDREIALRLAQAHDDAGQLRAALARQSHVAREQLDRLSGAGVELRMMAVLLADAREQVGELDGDLVDVVRKAGDDAATRDVAERGMAIARTIYAMIEGAPWWWRFGTHRWRARRIARRLRREQLFDGALYLEQYPDVAVQRMNPVRHVLLHGIAEGRSF